MYKLLLNHLEKVKKQNQNRKKTRQMKKGSVQI